MSEKNKAEAITRTLLEIIGVKFDFERVENYIQNELDIHTKEFELKEVMELLVTLEDEGDLAWLEDCLHGEAGDAITKLRYKAIDWPRKGDKSV